MLLDQDIEFIRMMIFDERGKKDADKIIQEINNNKIIQKYFKVTDNGESAMEHIFKGYQAECGLFNGYHSEYLYPNLYYDASIANNIDRSKIYQLDIEHKKGNTFFPIQMSCKDIIIAALLAYRGYDKQAGKRADIIYVQEYHMPINICLTEEQKIFDAYPIIK